MPDLISPEQRHKNMSVIQAKGHSMEPLIHDGDLCLFEFYRTSA